MELVRRVDPLRVSTVSVRMLGAASPLSLVVFVLRRSEPVVLEEQEIVHIQRKRKFWRGRVRVKKGEFFNEIRASTPCTAARAGSSRPASRTSSSAT